jgi:thioredoxin reductase
MSKVLVIGAGPIGLAAGLRALRRGHDTTILEADGAVGAALRGWGQTRFFSTLGMNLPDDARELLAPATTPSDRLLTGPEFADDVLSPLSETAPLSGRIRTNTRVVCVGRAGMNRTDFAGHPVRFERGFRVLVEVRSPQHDLREEVLEADAVIDASGTYGKPMWLGSGGMPAAGERASPLTILRNLGALWRQRDELAGRRVLLVGHGHSAANAIAMLEEIAIANSGTQVIWATRSLNRRPCTEVAMDPLPERQRVVNHANAIAARPPAWLSVERRASVETIERERVLLSGGRWVSVDAVIGLVGYRPDLSFLEELCLDISPVTEGSLRLTRALSNTTDCLSIPAVGSGDLASGEPGFWLAGAKSYGRGRSFLLQSGYAQVAAIVDSIA